MRRNRKNNIGKERIIMIASSAFVLAALTMTGIYMNGKNTESKDDGYTLDFATLEESADDKFEEIAQNNVALNEDESAIIEDDLDYMPMEVGSGQIEIPGLTKYSELDSGALSPERDDLMTEAEDTQLQEDVKTIAPEVPAIVSEEVSSDTPVVEQTLSFSEANGVLRPISGDIIMHYNMSSSVYFATLDQYKYNPAVIFTATQGDPISACAAGKVINIYNDSKIGTTIVIDMGSGYQATYGQLEDVKVSVDSYVNEGDIIASVAAPTKYYSAEGTNLYFALTCNGTPVNPESLFR